MTHLLWSFLYQTSSHELQGCQTPSELMNDMVGWCPALFSLRIFLDTGQMTTKVLVGLWINRWGPHGQQRVLHFPFLLFWIWRKTKNHVQGRASWGTVWNKLNTALILLPLYPVSGCMCLTHSISDVSTLLWASPRIRACFQKCYLEILFPTRAYGYLAWTLP